MNKLLLSILPLVLWVAFLPLEIVRADGEVDLGEFLGEAGQEATSENAQRQRGEVDPSRDLLPGEEVQTRSGKKMKVWSTKGPVPVSRAPEPFSDPRKDSIGNANIVIDSNRIRQKTERGVERRETGSIQSSVTKSTATQPKRNIRVEEIRRESPAKDSSVSKKLEKLSGSTENK